MLVAMRDLKLAPHGEIRAGQPVPEKTWAKLARRTRDALLSVGKVRVAEENTAPRRGRKKA